MLTVKVKVIYLLSGNKKVQNKSPDTKWETAPLVNGLNAVVISGNAATRTAHAQWDEWPLHLTHREHWSPLIPLRYQEAPTVSCSAGRSASSDRRDRLRSGLGLRGLSVSSPRLSGCIPRCCWAEAPGGSGRVHPDCNGMLRERGGKHGPARPGPPPRCPSADHRCVLVFERDSGPSWDYSQEP